MIIVDSSALLAILFNEPEKQSFQAILSSDERCVISAVNAHETACVLRARHDQSLLPAFWQLLIDNEIDIVPFDIVQVRAAVAAFDRYGKGIDPNNGARLNLCDCAAYALAKTMNAPLLFKGNDFPQTDVKTCF